MKGYLLEKYNKMTGSYTCYRFLEEAKQLGIELTILGVEDTTYQDGNYYNNGLLEPRDFLINRCKEVPFDTTKLATSSYNQTTSFHYYNNKYHQIEALKDSGLAIPIYHYGTNTNYEEVCNKLGSPFILKGLESSMGREIYLIETKEQFLSLENKQYLMEQYIQTSYGKDLRVYVVNKQIVACMKRQASQGFKANVALGATTTAYPITKEIQSFVATIDEYIELDYYGLDLLFGEDGFIFCELNVMAGIQGIEQATGINLAKRILEHIIESKKEEAISSIYTSYLAAKPYLDYQQLDSKKRNPQLTKTIIDQCNQDNCNIVVTGSKGKGTTARILSKLLESKGNIGLMTSPHILSFEDRIQVNSKQIEPIPFIHYIHQANHLLKDVPVLKHQYISPIGIQSIASLLYFKEKNTDYNIFECGKGVKYDDVNNINHTYAIINPIFLEHTRELGATIEEIVMDKLSIITPETKVVFLSKQNYPINDLILENIPSHCLVLRQDKDYSINNIRFSEQGIIFDVQAKYFYRDVHLNLYGKHMAENCALAICAYETITKEKWQQEKIIINVPGRLDVVRQSPLLVMDACIHERSSYEVIKLLEYKGIKKITFVAAVPDDKDYVGVIQTIAPYAKKIILTKTKNPHYHFSSTQLETIQALHIPCEYKEYVGILEEDVCYLGTTAFISELLQERN